MVFKKLTVTMGTVALLALSSPAAGWWSDDGEAPFGKLSDRLTTPHIDFASRQEKPLTVYVTAYGAGQREVAELRERFAFEPVFLPVKSRDSVNPWETARRKGTKPKLYLQSMDEPAYREEAEKRFARLGECDVLLLARTGLEHYPAADAARLVARVKEGAALVYISPDEKPAPIKDVELKEIPADTFFPVGLVPALKGTKLYAGQLGRGRVLEIVYARPSYALHPGRASCYLETLTPYDADDPLYYDFYHAFLGKALWWLTGREVKVKGEGERRIEQFFNELGEETEAGSRSAVLKLTRWLNAKGDTVDYQVEKVKVEGERRMLISFEKDAYPAGAPIPCRVVIPPTLNSQPSTLNLRVTLTDERGRGVWQGDFPDVSGEKTFTISFPDTRSRFAQVRAQLRKSPDSAAPHSSLPVPHSLLDEAFAKLYFNTLAYDRDDFCFSIWSDHPVNSRVSKLALREMRRAGVDNVMECALLYAGITPERRAEVPRWLHEAGLNFSIYSNHIDFPSGEAAHGKSCGLFDECEAFAKTGVYPDPGPDKGSRMPDGSVVRYRRLKNHRQDVAAGAKDLGVYFYNLGDEINLSKHGNPELENCFCDACQARFRKYLRKTFGSLAAMNREYRTKYASWDDVKALPLIEAAKQRRLSLWMDFRAFMEEQLVNVHLMEKAGLEEVDPGAYIGSEGYVYPYSSFTGYCFYKLLPHLRFGAPYYNDREVHALKYLQPGAVKSAWYGTYEGENVPAFSRRIPWQYLFSGLSGAFWYCSGLWAGEGVFANHCIFRPDFTPLEQFAVSAKEMDFIRASGLGKLLNGAKPAGAVVAVHYSNPCLHASTVNPTRTSWQFSHQDFALTLEQCSVPYEFLSPPEIEKDGVPGRFNVLMLPYSQALSDREVRAMRAFVERGGLLVADVLPGRLSEHGRLRKESPLKDLFGAKMEVKRTGKGAALFLDDRLQGVEALVGAGKAGPLAAELLDVFEPFGVRPFAKVTDDKDEARAVKFWTKDGFTYLCMMGPAEAVGRMAAAKGAEAGTRRGGAIGESPRRKVTLPRAMWAYDMNAGGRCLGRVTTLERTLPMTTGEVIALTDEEVKPLGLKLDKTSVRPCEGVTVSLSGVRGCALVSAVAPDGRIVWSERVTGKETVFAPAWNEPKGEYTIRAKTAVGGFETTAKVEVK